MPKVRSSTRHEPERSPDGEDEGPSPSKRTTETEMEDRILDRLFQRLVGSCMLVAPAVRLDGMVNMASTSAIGPIAAYRCNFRHTSGPLFNFKWIPVPYAITYALS